jgi:segregation and condensation protein A
MRVNHHKFSLNNFEGTLNALYSLVQRDEIHIEDLFLHQITTQFLMYLEKNEPSQLDEGAEFIGLLSWLLWHKSKALLPKPLTNESIEESDPLNLIDSLIEYSRFKEIARELSQMQESQAILFPRGLPSNEQKKSFGIEHLALEELSSLFNDLLAKATSKKKEIILEEQWQVSDKIALIRSSLKHNSNLQFFQIFTASPSREEIVVSFLAILELMKLGEVQVVKEKESGLILIQPYEIH